MILVVFGATGKTGKSVVGRALDAGHHVVAVARRPEAVSAREHLTVCRGDVLDPESVARAIVGADAVICAIGPAKSSEPGTLISQGVKNIVDGCQKAGVRRIVLESGLMVSDGSELSLLGRVAIGIFSGIFPKLRADKRIAETTMIECGLDWVIVRPPNLNQGPATGSYVAAPRARVFPAKAISHADCADVLIRATSDAAWVNQIVNVGRA